MIGKVENERSSSKERRNSDTNTPNSQSTMSTETSKVASMVQAGSNLMKVVGTAVAVNAITSMPVRTLSEDRNSKDSAILEACLERKKESFNQLKAWEEKRSAFLLTHKAIMDSVTMRIERRMRISEESMAQLLRFFKERKEQEATYSKIFSTKVPHLGHCWRDNSDKDSIWYPTLSKVLKETDESNESQGKNVATLVMFIEKNIIKDLLYHENEEFEKKVKVLRNNVSDQLSKLEKATAYTVKKNTSYANLYAQMLTSDFQASKLKKQRKDLLNVEIKFRQAAFDEINEQKQLGQQVLAFWEEGRKLESHRLESISQVFQLYMTKHQETYGALAQSQATLNSLKTFDFMKETSDNFSIDTILTAEEQSAIRKTLGSSNVESGDISRYFTNFSFKDISISQHSLVQKKFKIFRDVGSVTKSFKECWMVATVDDILLFYDEMSSKEAALPEYKKKGSAITDGGKKVNNCPKRKFRLDCIKAKPRDDPQHIDIIETTPGLLFSSTSKQLIKFIKDDDFEEFKVFMIRYQANLSNQQSGIEQSSASLLPEVS